jgi:hypothetical protein
MLYTCPEITYKHETVIGPYPNNKIHYSRPNHIITLLMIPWQLWAYIERAYFSYLKNKNIYTNTETELCIKLTKKTRQGSINQFLVI